MKSFEKAASAGQAAGRAGVGQVWLRRRQYEKAAEAFKLAERMDPSLALAHYGQGEVLRRQGKCTEAIPLLAKATELDRKFPDAQLALGDCQLQLKQYDKANAAFSEGLKWGPKWRPRFLVALGTVESARDSLRAAGVYFTRAREEAPGDPDVRRSLGEFYMSRGTWALATSELQAALNLDTTDIELRFAYAQALNFAGDRNNEALEQYQLVAARDKEFAPGQLGLGTMLFRAGNQGKVPSYHEQAVAPLKHYTELEPDSCRGWSALGRNYYYMKKPDEAFSAMQRAEQLCAHGNKEMYNVLGHLYADRKEWGKALENFAQGDPNPRDQLSIAQIMVFQCNMQTADSVWCTRADSVYTSIVTRDSTSSEGKFAMVELGKLKFRKKDYDGTIAMLERRNRLTPPSADAYYYIGLSRNVMKQYPEAQAALRRSVELDSTKGDRYFWLGAVSDAMKQPEDARVAFERSVQFDSSSALAGKAYRQLGFYRLLAKDWNGAVRLLERAVQLDAKDVQAYVWLAQGYQNAGNRSKAMESYRKALELDPNQPDAKKGIQVLSAAPSKGASP
jgi:tetratricopeptide (TPR) repeat protein